MDSNSWRRAIPCDPSLAFGESCAPRLTTAVLPTFRPLQCQVFRRCGLVDWFGMRTDPRSIVIVGAGVAGVRAAASLRARGFDGELKVVGREPHMPYDRPPLSKDFLLNPGSTEAGALLHDESFYRSSEIDLMLGQEVLRILPAERRVTLSSGRMIAADKVLLCTGGVPRQLNVDGAGLDGVCYLRSLDDAATLGERLSNAPAVVVIGGGFIGAEVAAAARQRGCEVTLVEIAPVPLAHVLGSTIGHVYAGLHRRHGVDVRTGVGVDSIRGSGKVREVLLSDGQLVPADLVVVGIGMLPDTQMAHESGIAVENGIVVDEYGRTSLEPVFAAGDVANRIDPRSGVRVRREHWQSAQRHAESVAACILGDMQVFEEIPWFWSDQFGHNLQLAGERREGDSTILRGSLEGMSFSSFSVRDGRLVGVVAVDRPRDVRAAMKLIEAGAHIDPALLSDSSVDLRQVVKQVVKRLEC